jgi:hypothetical protein
VKKTQSELKELIESPRFLTVEEAKMWWNKLGNQYPESFPKRTHLIEEKGEIRLEAGIP